MGGAVGVGVVAFFVAGRRARSVLGTAMPAPPRTEFDRRALFGSLAFGMGWGLGGFCPGPALVAFGSGQVKAAVFVAAMLAGMAVFEQRERGGARRLLRNGATAGSPW